ncbi:MAG: tetratricopeptide repeat protein [Cyanobium sp.]
MSSSPNRSRVGSRWLQGLAAAAAIAVALAGGWSLGRHQGLGRSGEDPKRAVVEREVRSLRLRLDREEASDTDRQRLLELLVALERKDEAIRLLEPMADREPDRWALRLMLAELRRDHGDRAGAERELRMILSRQGDQVEALQLMTLLLLEQGRGAQAETAVKAAFAGATTPVLKPEAMGVGLLLAELQWKRGRGGDAEATYRRLAEAFPQDQRPLLGLALHRHGLGDSKGAQEALAQARARNPRADQSDPRLDRLAASWGLAPLRAPAGEGKTPPAPASPAPRNP